MEYERLTNQEMVDLLKVYEKQSPDNYDSMRLNAYNIGEVLEHFCPSLGLGKPETVCLKIHLKSLANVLDEGLDKGEGCNPAKIQLLHEYVLEDIQRAKVELS
ncbi:hypothetical protein CMI46_00135 [Candidatus Pacearchaeota archaeon]|nr:hypothetical protein [Candidatus Pacearchaeota archaeon]|tara:strand:+ start:10898 stop:11206 length:309 start_codon:yes stop_codon:yes gene_type:complete